MTWTWTQRTGRLYRDGELVAQGYSGHGEGVNNPRLQEVSSIGPIPQGFWVIGPPFFSDSHGPFCLPLTPRFKTHRTGFLIHGDSITNAGKKAASLGCIILPREARMKIWDSGDRDLVVVDDVQLAVTA